VLFNSALLGHNGFMQRGVFTLLLAVSAFAAEWQPLFNGRDLTGWTNVNCAPSTWSAHDGIIISTGVPTGVLRTLREYENFILELEWKHIKPGGNAGLFVHSGALPVRGQPFTKAIEVQIIDRDHPEGIATSQGDVFSIQGATFKPDRPHPRGWMRCLPSERRARPAGEWNHYRVECKDGRVTLAVNGKEVSGGSECNPRKGFICLESEGSECHFRNIRIQELSPSREPSPDTHDLGFSSLYTGVDLSGWIAGDNAGGWKANDWNLDAGESGVLWSAREFANYELIVDWRFTSKQSESAIFLGKSNSAVKFVATDSQWHRSRILVREGAGSVSIDGVPAATLAGTPLRGPIGLGGGRLQFANLYLRQIAQVPADNAQTVKLVAGGGDGSNNVPAVEAGLRSPFGVDMDSSGNTYIIEMTGERLLKIDPSGMLKVIAGNGDRGYAGDGISASKAKFNGAHNLTVASNGDIYLADTWNNRVRRIDALTGTIHTIAGTLAKGFSGDGGAATNARFGGIYCASLDPRGANIYLTDLDNRRVRVVDLKSGIVRTVAGDGNKGIPPDGALATNAPLLDPRAVIANDEGEIYILERSGHALRRVDSKGRIRTVAGTGKQGNSGDGGNAREATLNGPKHLCFDRTGRVVIADTENHVIRVYDPKTEKIERLAGSGRRGRGGVGGPPLAVDLNQPHGVYVHESGALFIADSSNHRVLKVTP
jgi:hypothetical protein